MPPFKCFTEYTFCLARRVTFPSEPILDRSPPGSGELHQLCSTGLGQSICLLIPPNFRLLDSRISGLTPTDRFIMLLGFDFFIFLLSRFFFIYISFSVSFSTDISLPCSRTERLLEKIIILNKQNFRLAAPSPLTACCSPIDVYFSSFIFLCLTSNMLPITTSAFAAGLGCTTDSCCRIR